MSGNIAKKYFWLKLPKDFFQNPKIKKLRRIAGGDTYTIIYQKMMLLTLMTDGILEYEQIEDSFVGELALILDESEDNVEVTLTYLIAQGLLEKLDEVTYLLSEVPKLIGSETTSAERVRRHRDRLNSEKKDKKALHCNTQVTKCNTELEIELEIEKELELNTLAQNFELFWKSYPKKKSKTTALKAFKKQYKELPPIQDLLKIIETHKQTDDWQKSDGKFVPYPATWLNGGRWQDEIDSQGDSVWDDDVVEVLN